MPKSKLEISDARRQEIEALIMEMRRRMAEERFRLLEHVITMATAPEDRRP